MDQLPQHLCEPVKGWFKAKKCSSLLILPPKSGDFMPVIEFSQEIVRKMNLRGVDIKDREQLWQELSTTFHDPSTRTIIKQSISHLPDTLKIVLANGGNN